MMATATIMTRRAMQSFAVNGTEVFDLVVSCDLADEDCFAAARLSSTSWWATDFSFSLWERCSP